jgi:hypothetical protein
VHRTSVSWSLALLSPVCLVAAACAAEDPAGGTGGTGGVAGTATAGGAAGTTSSGGTSGTSAGAGSGAGATGGAAGSGVGGSGTGGSSGSAATGGSAGTPPIAGSGGTGLAGGAGGTGGGGSGTGGAGATAGDGAGGGSGGLPPTTCTITVSSAELAEKIQTVGIIEWSSDLAGITGARIEFGLDTSYGMSAPVDLTAANYRTLLLGMKQRTTYHFRVVASNGTGECAGPDATIETGGLTNGLPQLDINTPQPDKRAGGFVITGQYTTAGGTNPAYIFDADGDIVWAYGVNREVTGVRMSYDGKHMWINAANVPAQAGASVRRVSMDGSMDENLTQQFTGQNHQMTILPDETVAFYAYGENGCDDVKERAPNGMVKTIVNAADAHGAGGPCHLNTIQYSPEDDTLVFSDLDNDNITKVTRTGQTVWVLSGPTNDFTGDGSSWDTQHGIHVLGEDRLLIFNNASRQSGSHAIEILLNLQSMTATEEWSFTDSGLYNQVMGDVQRLPNGNTLVAYSTTGVLLQVDANSQVVDEWTWPLQGAFGYIEWRPDLYGPPEK